MDEQRQKEQINIEIEIKKEGANIDRTVDPVNQPDPSVGDRQLEFQTHPLYRKLQLYSRELADFIIQRKTFQEENQNQMLRIQKQTDFYKNNLLMGNSHDPNKAFLLQLKRKNLKPTKMMVSTRPAPNIQILF